MKHLSNYFGISALSLAFILAIAGLPSCSKDSEEEPVKGSEELSYDIAYSISYDHNVIVCPHEVNGDYSATIPMTFGIPEGSYKRGFREFGIAVAILDGTVDNTIGSKQEEAKVTTKEVNGKSMTCFSHTIDDDSAQQWATKIIMTSDNATFKVQYTHFIITKDGEYVFGDTFKTEAFVLENVREYVDLGLSVKWATYNVGANQPQEYGEYYSWGETEPKEVYDWSTYQYCEGTMESCYNLGGSICGTEYDVAHVKWGSTWRMPSVEEFKELIDNCSREWIYMNGTNGFKFTASNGNSIFLPGAGWINGSERLNQNHGACYWTGTLTAYPWASYFVHGGGDISLANANRYDGYTVRPVAE